MAGAVAGAPEATSAEGGVFELLAALAAEGDASPAGSAVPVAPVVPPGSPPLAALPLDVLTALVAGPAVAEMPGAPAETFDERAADSAESPEAISAAPASALFVAPLPSQTAPEPARPVDSAQAQAIAATTPARADAAPAAVATASERITPAAAWPGADLPMLSQTSPMAPADPFTIGEPEIAMAFAPAAAKPAGEDVASSSAATVPPAEASAHAPALRPAGRAPAEREEAGPEKGTAPKGESLQEVEAAKAEERGPPKIEMISIAAAGEAPAREITRAGGEPAAIDRPAQAAVHPGSSAPLGLTALPEAARATIPVVQHVPLGAVPVEIVAKSLAGLNRPLANVKTIGLGSP